MTTANLQTAAAEGPSAVIPVSIDAFRQGMRRLTGAVNLITTAHDGKPHGLTATAVCSLSGQPPRLLACVNVVGKTFEYILQSRRMGVSVLGYRHVDLAKRFANMTDEDPIDRFADSDWTTLHSGAPVLTDALVGFDCTVDEIFVTPSHGVIIGEIKHVLFGEGEQPLLYSNGNFTTLRGDA